MVLRGASRTRGGPAIASRRIAELEGEAASGEFVGAFDTDDTRRWRFIPAAEREELSVAPRGG